ncbi:MAG: class I mannose-6-phosphate isomerase, partial [Clostridia bacterium]|nr:class I mannose-6-phosphate isomerase [Clostridia bacterium]
MYPLLLKNYSLSQTDALAINVKPEDYSDAQAYLLSGRDDSESVIKNGAFGGLGLNEALPQISDTVFPYGFPITVKHITTRERLPVKVYPDDEYAALHGERAGKISLVYIIDCKDAAEMVYGLSRNVSPEELKSRVQNGSLSTVCNFVNCKKGDVFFIPPGIVFAVGAGISALVISTNSNSEYIISDYGRIGEGGKPRPLQINRALDVMKTRKNNLSYGNTGDMELFPFGTVRELGSCDIFKTELVTMDGNMGFYEDEKLVSIILISGELDMSFASGN